MRPEFPSRPAQHGLGLIEVLVAMLVFSFGLMGLAALYVRAAPAPFVNQTVMAVQTAADSLMATLATQPASLASLSVSGVSSPTKLPTWLQGWLTQAHTQVPSLTVSIVPGKDALGNPCSAQSCGITATLSWTQGSAQRSQVFHAQIGIHN